MNKDCKYAFLLNSCDSYSDTWEPFFDLLQIYWPNIPCKIYLNTETKRFDDSKYPFDVITLNTNPKLRWGGRLRSCLDRIGEDYILMTLDDYFICSAINEELINALITKMENDKNIASFQLIASRLIATNGYNSNSDLQFDFYEVGPEGRKTHFVPTIWRKSVLYNWLRKHESIWGFESYGSKRARMWRYKEKVYEVRNPLIYDYFWTKSCCSAIVNGKWIDDFAVEQLFDKNGIKIDLSKRGRITLEEYSSHDMKYVLSQLSLKDIIVKLFLRIRSLW